MTIARSRTFRGKYGQAFLLPKDMAFDNGVELIVVRSGDVLTCYPAAMSVPDMIAELRSLPAPPSVEKRDVLI
jgi:antitoxin VapB